MHLYEDLAALGRSAKLVAAMRDGRIVVNTQNKRRGIEARRGDGTLGEIIPGETPIFDPGYIVGRGKIATVEIGVEVKILAKAMIRQVGRVITDLGNQVREFKRGGGRPICVAVIGINEARHTVGYEADRSYPTTGSGRYLHPYQEAAKAEERLNRKVRDAFDEFLVLRYRATNEAPYGFEWVSYRDTELDYAAALARISSQYQQRF